MGNRDTACYVLPLPKAMLSLASLPSLYTSLLRHGLSAMLPLFLAASLPTAQSHKSGWSGVRAPGAGLDRHVE